MVALAKGQIAKHWRSVRNDMTMMAFQRAARCGR
jgi:hypothetical protein